MTSPGVQVVVDEVDRTSADFHAVGKRFGRRPQRAGEGWQQRVMGIDNAISKGLEDDWRENPVVPGQDEQIDPGIDEHFAHRVVSLARVPVGRLGKRQRGNSGGPCSLERCRAGPIARDDDDLGR